LVLQAKICCDAAFHARRHVSHNFAIHLRGVQAMSCHAARALAGVGRRWAIGVALAAAWPSLAAADLVVDGAPGDVAALAAGVPAGTTVTGSGVLAGSVNPAAPTVIDGAVVGDSLDAPIVATGYVAGSGWVDHVSFAGHYSPGHSPALVTVGSVIYTGANVLEMELGGVLPGSQHDKIVHTGASAAGGTLQVTLINAFTPSAGNVFDIFDWNAGVSGTFSTVFLPPLNVGLVWNASDLYAGGTISVVAVPEVSAGLLGAVVVGLAAVRVACSGVRERV
jgi:hypothetical protein